MIRIIAKSNFFSCDVKIKDKKVEGYLKSIKEAWLSYKSFGQRRYWMFSEYQLLRAFDSDSDNQFKNINPDSIPGDMRIDKINDDILTVKIEKC